MPTEMLYHKATCADTKTGVGVRGSREVEGGGRRDLWKYKVFCFSFFVVVVVSSNYRLPRVSLLRIYHNALEVIESNMAIVYSSLITSLQ